MILRPEEIAEKSDIAPSYLQNLFIPVNEAHNHNLGFSDTNVKIPFPHTEYLKRSLSYSGALLWNSLPSTLRNVPYVNNFNNLLTTYSF